jgi:VWFA-related protein
VTRPILRLALAGAALFFALPPSPAAQEDDATGGDSIFFEQIAVDIVNVEVYVSDKQGDPVEGLTRDDFVVTEDGKPVEVVNFYRATDGLPSPEAETAAEPEPQAVGPGLPQLVEELEVPESQRLHLIVYVDNFNIHPLDRNRVFSRLRLFLNDIVRPGDQVLVASYDRSLHIRQPFTGSADVVNRALLELEDVSGSAVERESERSDALKEIYETDSSHKAEFRAKAFAENQYQEMENALEALGEMIDSLGGIPGRKMMIHLSNGIPMVPGEDLYLAIQQRFHDMSAMGEAFNYDLSTEYLELIAQANSNRISFYTIDAGGLRTRSGYGAENPTVNSQIPIGMSVDGMRNQNLQGTLKLMANRTGGRAILNTNDVTAGLRRAAGDFGTYYSLGYRAPDDDRGRYHHIEVRLKDPGRGWDVRHREGYRDKSLEAQVYDGIKTYLVHGFEENPLGVSIDLGEQSAAAADGLVLVPVRIRVPMENIVLLPRGERYDGQLRIYFGATDEEGRDAPTQELPFELRIPASSIELARHDEMARVIELRMRPGRHNLVVAVRDELGAELSVVGRLLMVGTDEERRRDTPSIDLDLGN